MKEYIVKLKQKEQVAQETWKFTFEKPVDFTFQAGQYTFLEIINTKFTDDRLNSRAMSFASAPKDNFLDFVMRESESAFKKNMVSLKAGKEIKIKSPIGDFLLPKEKNQPIVFLIAGVGITPVRSMLRQEEFENSERKITLFYSNRNAESIALHHEIESFDLKNYKCINTITRDFNNWTGERGRINETMLTQHLDDIKNSLYYVVGTKNFIDAMRNLLKEMQIADENIIFDNFG